MLLGLLALVAWFALLLGMYFFARGAVTKELDKLSPRERLELLQTRRQRYLKTFSKNNNKTN
jgi:hypothetical protein